MIGGTVDLVEAEMRRLSVAGVDGMTRQDLCTCGISVCIEFFRMQMSSREKVVGWRKEEVRLIGRQKTEQGQT